MLGLRKILILLSLSPVSACASPAAAAPCNPNDQDGVVGGSSTVLLNVSDTAFAVGGVDSGSTEPNIAVQNRSTVTLTLTNVGSTPHGLRIACLAAGSAPGCPALSCFPDNANIPALAPGARATTTFATPAVEGAYLFTSDKPGAASPDGGSGSSGLVGEFVLL